MGIARSRTWDLPVSPSDGEIRLVPRLRERHLTPQVDEALVQATGFTLSIWICTDQDCIKITLPLTEFVAERPFKRAIHRWGINLNRWVDVLETEPADDCIHVTARVDTLDIEYNSDDVDDETETETETESDDGE